MFKYVYVIWLHMLININVYKYAYKYARINMYKNMHVILYAYVLQTF